jgi:hypothetical protein
LNFVDLQYFSGVEWCDDSKKNRSVNTKMLYQNLYSKTQFLGIIINAKPNIILCLPVMQGSSFLPRQTSGRNQEAWQIV